MSINIYFSDIITQLLNMTPSQISFYDDADVDEDDCREPLLLPGPKIMRPHSVITS